jgi:hypothetical protein
MNRSEEEKRYFLEEYHPDSEITISEHYNPNKDFGHNLADMIFSSSKDRYNSIKVEVFKKKDIRDKIFNKVNIVRDLHLDNIRRFAEDNIKKDISRFS